MREGERQVPANKPTRIQFSVRELMALAALVAIGITLLTQVRRNQVLESRLSSILHRPHLQIHEPTPWKLTYSSNSPIVVSGRLVSNDDSFTQLRVEVSMIDPKTESPLCNTNTTVIANPDHGFAVTLDHGGNLPAGYYPIICEVFDSTGRVAGAAKVVKIVE